MVKRRAYVETTIPSFYHEVRTAPDIVARKQWTRQWWDLAQGRYELVTSAPVLDELAGGIPERGAERIALLREVSILPVDSAILEIVNVYVQHLANANKFGHIRRVNRMLGLFVPLLVTPLELLGGNHDDPA